MRTSSIRCTPYSILISTMWQVTVLCPRARRCNLKVTPNTVLLQVLEQACSKQKLDPALYTIKHHGKLLDLSLPLRFSGIPNNGKVELVEAARPRSDDGEVVVAVQNVDGTRVQSSFHSTTSLWDVLIQHKLDSSPGGMEPCLSYMRLEVSGEKSLRSTQLRSIGLSSGRGVLRLSHRTVSKSEEDANTREQENTKGEIKSASQDGGRGEEGRLVRRTEDDNEPRRKPPPTCGVAKDTTEGGEELPYFPAHPISYFPREEDESPGGPDRMEGVEISDSSSNFSLESSSAAAMALISGALTQPHNFPPEVVAAQLEEVASSPFSQFAGVMRSRPLDRPISRPQLPKVYDEPCDRERVVYSLDDPLPLPAHDEVSAKFFEHTVTDVHVMHSDLKRQASASDAPLMTRAMRAVRDEMRLEKYEKSIARVYFPDRWVLQGCFRPRESLKMLVKFVRENLADPNVKFHLYTTPPKKVLRSAKITFAEAEFLPTAVVYVGVEDDQPHPTLSDSALQQAASSLQAEIVHQKNRSHTEKHQTVQPHPERGGPSHHPPSSLPSPVPGSSGQARVGGSSDGASPSKLPKWFHGPR